jgi:type I restriction enzyme M protein
MLDTITKKRIDDCRDILVGKLPDPKSQIEQITIALIYKFMDDMDKESIELGGEAKFFSGDFEKYSWDNLFDTKVSAQEMLNLYSKSIESMEKNPKIPQLFRDIFKNAYLPYRDPETLKLFLKTISEFEYTHSEKLGDAFEYLLSVMGSQGDAGQFRTPRHIIDFLVKIVNPTKDETVLDPACGTAGFLISAFKHIQDNTQLTPDDRAKLIKNFVGYDISPEMVKLSLVNLYLHGFLDPHIFEYDTLTSEERWDESFDVVLANPPFMSPKGGIRPHKRFSVTSNRSEVLFVDYIAEHLNPKGRAGIIVPEGVIFQSGNAYKELRKMLVENYLYAVVSLPSGVFNPYSGVKTSILVMDKTLAKQSDKILFVKIENDGYSLGSQRADVKGSQLDEAVEVLNSFKETVINQKEFTNIPMAHAVEKSKIAESGEYNLSGERYKNIDKNSSNKSLINLDDICTFKRGPFGGSLKKEIFVDDGYAIYEQSHAINNQFNNFKYFITDEKFNEMKSFEVQPGDIIMSCSGTMGKVAIIPDNAPKGIINQALLKLTPNANISSKYLKLLMESDSFQEEINKTTMGVAIKNVASVKVLKKIRIPLPSLPIQQEIIKDVEEYQNEIDELKRLIEKKELQIKKRIANMWNE